MTIFTRSSNTLSPELFLVELNSAFREDLSGSTDSRLPWRANGANLADMFRRLLLGK